MKKKKPRKKGKKGRRSWQQLTFPGKVWRVLWVSVLSVWLFTVVQVLFCGVFNPPLTPLMVQRFFQQVSDSERSVRFERDYVSIDEVSPHLVNAVVVAEDGLFMYHRGFDVKQLKQSYRDNKRGRRVRGGSTISMQTSKNCFLPHNRTMWRKAAEAYYTTLIELIWGKKRIMECYLNIVEFGDGIYGCEAASQHYFHHPASKLTKAEAAQLAATLPSPLKRNPAHQSPYFKKRSSTIRQRMDKYGKVNLDARRKDLNPKYLKQTDESLLDFLLWMSKQD